MALVQYGGGVVSFRGSLAGNTYQRTAAGEIVRHRRCIKPRPTSKSSAVLGDTYALTVAWRNLTEDNQALWNAFAAAHPRVNIYGQIKTISGNNWFVTINSNLLLIGMTVISVPPAYTLPTAIQDFELVSIGQHVAANYTMAAIPVDTILIIFSTPPLQGTTLSFRSNIRYTAQLTAQLSEDYEFANQWIVTHGLQLPPSDPASFNIGAHIYPVHADTGITGLARLDQTKWTPV